MPHIQTKSEKNKQSMALPSLGPSGTCTLSVRATSAEDRTTCTTLQRQSTTNSEASECKVPTELWRNKASIAVSALLIVMQKRVPAKREDGHLPRAGATSESAHFMEK